MGGQMVILHFEVVSALRSSPIAVASVTGPIPPYTPADPSIKLIVKNVGNLPIISLNTTLQTSSGSYSFVFGVNSSDPLLAGQSAQSTQIGMGFQTGKDYPLTISGILSNGLPFTFTQQVSISSPSS